MTYNRILSRKFELDKKIASLDRQLQDLPPGKLICTHSGPYSKWYQSDGKNKVYIPKSNRVLAEKLAVKKFLSLSLTEAKKELRAVRFYLDHYSPSDSIQRLITQQSEYQTLLSPYFKPLSQELFEWVNEPYEQNSLFPEQKIHRGASGNKLRSKSEAMIDIYLSMYHIPFRYECRLCIGDFCAYPDFTIRHPKTGKIIYWEHFGRMDDPQYISRTYTKLHSYALHGIIPTIQLITTYETQANPLTVETIEKIIQDYLLS